MDEILRKQEPVHESELTPDQRKILENHRWTYHGDIRCYYPPYDDDKGSSLYVPEFSSSSYSSPYGQHRKPVDKNSHYMSVTNYGSINEHHEPGGPKQHSMQQQDFNRAFHDKRSMNMRDISENQAAHLLRNSWQIGEEGWYYPPAPPAHTQAQTLSGLQAIEEEVPPPPSPAHTPASTMSSGPDTRTPPHVDSTHQHSQPPPSKQQHAANDHSAKQPAPTIQQHAEDGQKLKDELAAKEALVHKLQQEMAAEKEKVKRLENHHFHEINLKELATAIEHIKGDDPDLKTIGSLGHNITEMHSNAKDNLDLASEEYKFMDIIESLMHNNLKRNKWEKEKKPQMGVLNRIYHIGYGDKLKNRVETYSAEIEQNPQYLKHNSPAIEARPVPKRQASKKVPLNKTGLWINVPPF